MAEQKEQASSFRVTYYGFTGRARSLREAAALGGIAFEDKFITQADQKQQKADGLRRWSGPPEITILDKDGKDVVTIGQSNACTRYIGAISGTYPKGLVERALVDECLDSSEDLSGAILKAAFGDEESKKKAAEAMLKKDSVFAYWMGKFELRLEENEKRGNKNGLLVGDSITIADLKFVSVFTYIGMVPKAMDFVKENFKRVAALAEAVPKNEKIAAFNEVFAKNMEAAKKDGKMEFKYPGKAVYSDL